MAKRMSADDILPLVATLAPQERARLFRLMAGQPSDDDSSLYDATPPRHSEFSNNNEPLAWEADGWEDIG